MSTDENRKKIRAEAARRWPEQRHLRDSWDSVGMQHAFLMGAEWAIAEQRASRDVVDQAKVQPREEDAHDRDRMGICRKCGIGLTAVEILDGETRCIKTQENEGTRPWRDLSTTGLLWLINRQVFHPRGFAFTLHVDEQTVEGWSLQGDGREPWNFEDGTESELLAASNETLTLHDAERSDS